MKVLVTGHRGFLGRVLTDLMDKEGIEWEGLDIGLYDPGPLDMRQDVRRARVRGFDCIIHLAAIVGEPACMYMRDWSKKINVGGSINIVDEAVAEQVPMIFASTCSVYGSADCVIFEDYEVNPLGPYARDRLEAEKYALERDAISIRFGTLYGISPRMRNDLVINKWASLVAQGKPIVVDGGKQWRPFCEVHDAAKALILLARETQRTGDHGGRVFNCTSLNVQIRELASMFQKVRAKVEFNGTIEDMRNYRVANQRLTALKWEPDTGIIEQIGGLVEAFKKMKDYNSVFLSNVETLKFRFNVV